MHQEHAIRQPTGRIFVAVARITLSLVVVGILAAVQTDTLHIFYDLRLVFREDFHDAFKIILIDILTVLAPVEALRTTLDYFIEGRVKVTYIIDTVIVSILAADARVLRRTEPSKRDPRPLLSPSGLPTSGGKRWQW